MSATAVRSIFVARSENSYSRRAVRQVLQVLGFNLVGSIEEAEIVLTANPADSLEALKENRNVIEATPSRESPSLVSALKAAYGNRYVRVSNLDTLVVEVARAAREFQAVNLEEQAPLQTEVCARPELRQKRILVVDDLLINRKMAAAQLANARELVVESSYVAALHALYRGEHFDIVMTDLQMPTEAFLLGKNAQQKIGTPLPAGLYIVLAAIAVDVRDIIVLTHGSHHDNGIVAALDLLHSFHKGDSYVSFLKFAQSTDVAKDWTCAYEEHLEKHLRL